MQSEVEVRRVYDPDDAQAIRHRGRGLATVLIAHLENHLREGGVYLVRLEAGPRQPEALSLYGRLGYQRCGPFGSYPNDPMSVFMEKRL